MSDTWLANPVILILSPGCLLMGSGIGTYLGSKGGSVNRTARLLSYIGMYISLPSLFLWTIFPAPSRKSRAIFFIVSPAGTLKKFRMLLMVYFHLLAPSEVACAAAVVEPHANGT